MKVIIIGAGAAGLMAAYTLAKKKIEVLLLEAENRIGGRVHTLVPPGFTSQLESGAEFIHGKLPLTLQLFKKAGLPVKPVSGEMLSVENGKIRRGFGESKSWEEFYEHAAKLDSDCSLEEFLEKYFNAKKYDLLCKEARDMAQGLDLADSSLLSVQSIRDEWSSSETEYRPVSGYFSLLEFLRNEAAGPDYHIRLNTSVERIKWKSGHVSVYTSDKVFEADAAILAVPLSVYHQEAISIEPSPSRAFNLFRQIGLGGVIKIALEFEYSFWEESYPEMGFLFTEDGITFWTQLSLRKPMLMGWLGDMHAGKMDKLSDARLIEFALDSLSKIFELEITKLFKAGAVFRYTRDSKFGGGYSYLMPQSKAAIKQLNQGIDDTLWFAGEAMNPTYEAGTVEAALQSGRFTANKVIRSVAMR